MARALEEVTEVTLSDGEVLQLGERGFFVRDGFLGEARALALHQEAQNWVEEGRFEQAGVGRGARRRLSAEVRGDWRVWVTEALVSAEAANLRQHFEALQEALNASAYLGLKKLEVQLAHYPGSGARYDRHLDALSGAAGRRATAIVYLNPSWASSDGGQLRLHVRPEPIDLEPRLDRLIVFLSERVEHEVLPTDAPRFAATGWFSK